MKPDIGTVLDSYVWSVTQQGLVILLRSTLQKKKKKKKEMGKNKMYQARSTFIKRSMHDGNTESSNAFSGSSATTYTFGVMSGTKKV